MIINEHIEPWSEEGYEAMLTRVRRAFEQAGCDPSTMKLLPMSGEPQTTQEVVYQWQADETR